MSGAVVWDTGEAAARDAAVTGAAAGPKDEWEPASQRDDGMGTSTAGSGYPETKDNGTEDAAQLFGNDLASKSVQGLGGGGDDPAALPAVVLGPAGGAGGAGPYGTNASNGGTAYPSGSYPSGVSSTLTKRRNSMAFEIARMERAGKTLPPANLAKARRAWELSRPRYVEETSDRGGGSNSIGGGRGAGGKRRVRVPPGQESRDAVPYGVWGTSWAQMGDFGLDIGMYFVSLAQLIVVFLVYAALSVVAMIHFSSDQYSGAQVGGLVLLSSLSLLLLFSRSPLMFFFCASLFGLTFSFHFFSRLI